MANNEMQILLFIRLAQSESLNVVLLYIYIYIYICNMQNAYNPKPVGWDSSVGIVACYRLDGPGIGSWWGTRFSAHIQTGLGAHPASYTVGTMPCPGAWC
jgi:hypothetical protein